MSGGNAVYIKCKIKTKKKKAADFFSSFFSFFFFIHISIQKSTEIHTAIVEIKFSWYKQIEKILKLCVDVHLYEKNDSQVKIKNFMMWKIKKDLKDTGVRCEKDDKI